MAMVDEQSHGLQCGCKKKKSYFAKQKWLSDDFWAKKGPVILETSLAEMCYLDDVFFLYKLLPLQIAGDLGLGGHPVEVGKAILHHDPDATGDELHVSLRGTAQEHPGQIVTRQKILCCCILFWLRVWFWRGEGRKWGQFGSRGEGGGGGEIQRG